jgi:hypothetical protein
MDDIGVDAKSMDYRTDERIAIREAVKHLIMEAHPKSLHEIGRVMMLAG